MGVVGYGCAVIPVPNELEGAQHGASMVPVAMREDDAFDGCEIGCKPGDVLLEHPVFAAGVEQKRAADGASARRDEAGEAVRGAAEAAPTEHPRALPASLQGGHLSLDERRDCGEIVRHIVDEHVDIHAVDWLER